MGSQLPITKWYSRINSSLHLRWHKGKIDNGRQQRPLKVIMGKSLMKTYIDKEKPWGFVIVLVKENRFVWCWSSPICNSPYYIIIFTAGHGTNNQAEFSAL